MKNGMNLSKAFLTIMLLAGILILMLTPPITVPDENTHFLRAYSISHGQLLPAVKDGVIGSYFPSNIYDFAQNNEAKYHGKLDVKYDFGSYYFDSWLIQDKSPVVFYPYSLADANPLAYLFSSLGMAVGSILLKHFATPYNLLLFGRLFNFIFYTAVITISIRNTPKYKRTMFVLALMPMSVFLGISMSYDAILISACFLLFSMVMKLRFSAADYTITKWDIFAILLVAVLLSAVKTVYALLLLALLAVPMQKFATRRRYWMLVGITIAVAAAAAFIPMLASRSVTSQVIQEVKAHEQEQKQFLLTHLIQIPHILFNTVHQLRNFYLAGFFGILGMLDTNFAVPVVAVFYLVLLYLILVDSFAAGSAGKVFKGTTFFSVATILLASFYVMYVSWTSIPGIGGIGIDYVTGMQGRYFIPLSIFAFSLLSNGFLAKNKILQRLDQSGDSVAVYTGAVCCILSIFTLYARFWS